MAPKDRNREVADADSGTSEELEVSLTNMLLGQDPIVIRNNQSAARDNQPTPYTPANEPDVEADFSLPKSSANDTDGDEASAHCAVDDNSGASSSSKAESSGESASCLNNQSKDTCMKDVPCVKDVECLKGVGKEFTDSASAGSQPDTSEISAEASSDKTDSGVAEEQADGDKTVASKESETTTENDGAVDPESLAPTSSGGESGNEIEFSDKHDKFSTDASTLGEESSDGVSSAKEELQKVPPKLAGKKIENGGCAWTVSEDHMLRGIKESDGNLSWADIGKILNRNKNDVKGRWKVIRDQPQQFEAGEQASGDEKISGVEAQDTVESSKGADDPGDSLKRTNTSARPSKEAQESAQSSQASKAATKSSKEGKKPETSHKENQGKGKTKADTAAKWHKGKRNGRVAMENKAVRSKAAEVNERERDILSGEEASSESSFVFEDEEDDEDDEIGPFYGWPKQKRHDIQYLQNTVYKAMYPSMIQPEPDEFFGERDCAVLASVDSKYKRGKWLEMQANFYNVTGRMVPLHIIRDKCERAERDGALQLQEAGASRAALDDSSRRENVERWVHDLPEEGLEAPDL